MATATQSRASQQPQTQPKDLDAAQAERLLDQVIANTGNKLGAMSALVQSALDKRLDTIRDALPANMKDEAPRLVRRAILYLNSKPELAQCPPAAFVLCVLRAAEMGLALDGRLCYVVNYKGTYQVQPDYKGLVAVAKRSGQIKDCKADVVYQSDTFGYGHEDGRDKLTHDPNLEAADRGEVIAAYASFILPDGSFRCCVMSRADLNKVQRHAPAKGGPWSTWTEEMQKKTVIKRGLKLYCDDPGVLAAIDLDNETVELEQPATTVLPVGRLDLRSRPTVAQVLNGNGHAAEPAPLTPAEESDNAQVAEAADRGDACES